MFTPSTAHDFCKNNICERNINLSCCGEHCYNGTEEICCNDHPDKLPRNVTSSQADCCDKKAYDPVEKICCGKEKLHKSKDGAVMCCGKEGYDKDTEMCCAGDKVEKIKRGCDK